MRKLKVGDRTIQVDKYTTYSRCGELIKIDGYTPFIVYHIRWDNSLLGTCLEYGIDYDYQYYRDNKLKELGI